MKNQPSIWLGLSVTVFFNYQVETVRSGSVHSIPVQSIAEGESLRSGSFSQNILHLSHNMVKQREYSESRAKEMANKFESTDEI